MLKKKKFSKRRIQCFNLNLSVLSSAATYHPAHTNWLQEDWHAALQHHQHTVAARGYAPDLEPDHAREQQAPEHDHTQATQKHDGIVGALQVELIQDSQYVLPAIYGLSSLVLSKTLLKCHLKEK